MKDVSLTRRVAGAGMLCVAGLRAERVHGLIDFEAHGLVDVHPHDQVHAALEVEAALDRLGVVLRRDDGDGEHHQHGEDQHDFPDDVSIQGFLQHASNDSLSSNQVSDSPVTTPEIAERATLTFTFSAIFRYTASGSTP